ncbi:MAG: hypothetical protein MH204_01730, partial [Fimbriimonadaceae bacterium]|nr:hypothetical protein [Fimbriimonadaceae bacterium]
MEERARIRMTGELEVIEVNSAAARLLAIHPLDLLGRPGSAAPEPWGPALSEAGRDTEVVRWAAEPTGWSVHLSPPAAADLDGLFAAAALADSEEAARGL